MRTSMNVAGSACDCPDDLRVIKGIGPKFSQALVESGIHCFSDLAQYTPEEVSKLLFEQGHIEVSPERIRSKRWISQAREMAEQANTKESALHETAGAARAQEESANEPVWHQHAEFSLFFDYIIDEHDGQIWQTRVYNGRSGDEEPLPGFEPAQWVDWILERANLPIEQIKPSTNTKASAKLATSVTNETKLAAPVTTFDTAPRILGVEISKADSTAENGEKMLVAKLHFQLLKPDAKAAADRAHFGIYVHVKNLDTSEMDLADSIQSRLEPGKLTYTKELRFPLPDLGRYELQSLVLLLPPVGKMALHSGPAFSVVP